MPHEVEVTTPKAINLDIKFSNGKSVLCPPGSTVKALLTGDEIGYVQAQFEAARKQCRREGNKDADCDGGGIKVLDKEYDAIPEGSKKDRALHPEKYADKPAAPEKVKPVKAEPAKSK